MPKGNPAGYLPRAKRIPPTPRAKGLPPEIDRSKPAPRPWLPSKRPSAPGLPPVTEKSRGTAPLPSAPGLPTDTLKRAREAAYKLRRR